MGKCVHRDITIRGVTYATMPEAARALGVQTQTIWKAWKAGRLDQAGMGMGYQPVMPVRINGVTYASDKAAAADLGVARGTIRAAIAKGREDRVGKPPRRRVQGKAIKIGPFTFASLAQASRALGFCEAYVSVALRKPRACHAQKLMAAAMRLQARLDQDNRRAA